MRLAITPPEVNGFGWNLGHSEYIVWSWPWHILGTICAEARTGEWVEILFFFCPVNNARLYRFPISHISKIRTQDVNMCRHEPLQNIFENLPIRGLISKKVNFLGKIFNNFGLQAVICTTWLQIVETHGGLVNLRNVVFPFVSLESTQNDSHGL